MLKILNNSSQQADAKIHVKKRSIKFSPLYLQRTHQLGGSHRGKHLLKSAASIRALMSKNPQENLLIVFRRTNFIDDMKLDYKRERTHERGYKKALELDNNEAEL